MTRGIRRGVIAAVAGAFVVLGGAAPAVAAPAADAPFTISATDMSYGQPDLNGYRRTENKVTFTNTSAEDIEFPVLTFPRNGRDEALHSDWNDCPGMSGGPDFIKCYAEPIAAGATTTLVLPWGSDARPVAGPATVRIEQAVERWGEVVPGTASETRWQVSFDKLTGTFDITATDLRYGPVETDGYRRGSTTVTITNLTQQTVEYPLITFPSWAGDPDHTRWNDCVVAHGSSAKTVCVTAPLPAGDSLTITFPFLTNENWTEFEANVRVDAGADRDGTVVEGTAAGTQYTVFDPR